MACFVLERFGTTGGPWFPTEFWVFCRLYRGLTPYEKNVARRGPFSFHRGLAPYEKVRFATTFQLDRVARAGTHTGFCLWPTPVAGTRAGFHNFPALEQFGTTGGPWFPTFFLYFVFYIGG